MKIVYIGVLQNAQQPAVELCAERDLSSYSRFTRASISEFMTMFSKTVAERTKQGQRQDIQEQDFTFHVYSRTQGIAGVIISDKEYPSLAAHQILSKVLDEFLAQNPVAGTSREPIPFPALKTYITMYQDPQQVDSIMKIQKELDETKIVLHKTIESVLERGEKIDDLVSKSEGLSAQSKMFYTSAKKQNSCCVIIDTTSIALSTIFYELVRHPEEIEKLRAELEPYADDPTGEFLHSEIGHLDHLNGVSNEALRLYPPVPGAALQRKTPTEGIEVDGVYIPGDMVVYCPMYVIGRSELSYEKPYEFIPERWYKYPDLIKDKSAFAPFTLGPYHCIGRPLALLNLRTTVARLIMTFDVEFASGQNGSEFIGKMQDRFVLYPGEVES